MNNYHIYEEIGRGKYSVVYKGRKKKSIEYPKSFVNSLHCTYKPNSSLNKPNSTNAESVQI